MHESLEELLDEVLTYFEHPARELDYHYHFEDLRKALTERQHTMDLERIFLDSMYEAVGDSNWIPPEYFMNDWASDVCHFLRTGKGIDDARCA